MWGVAYLCAHISVFLKRRTISEEQKWIFCVQYSKDSRVEGRNQPMEEKVTNVIGAERKRQGDQTC